MEYETFDPSGLNKSEVDIEFSIRKLDGTRPDAMRELAENMMLEDTNKRNRPTMLHPSFTTVEVELQICDRKIRELVIEVDKACASRTTLMFIWYAIKLNMLKEGYLE